MADDQAQDRPSAEPQTPVNNPHDKYFFDVFSDAGNAAGLLRPHLPQAVANSLRWSTLTHLPGRFVSDDWRGREADLLFSVERRDAGPPVLVYVLLEHQSTPDRWMRLRLLNYCVQVWMKWRREHENEPRLPLIVPVVFYQGAEPWRHERKFEELVAGAEPGWDWVPRFEHLLIDQTGRSADSVTGDAGARLAQVAMMATYGRAWRELLERTAQLMGELYPAAGFDEVAMHVEYVLMTQPEERHRAFGAALRRHVPGRGGVLMNYVERMVERGRREGIREGRQEGELRGKVQTIQGLLGRDVPWSTIEAATGIDEANFRRLKQQCNDDGVAEQRG